MFRDKPLHNFLFETDDTGFYKNLHPYCTPWIDVCCILHLLRFRKPKTFLEVGTHRGYTTRILAEKFPAMKIVTVDPGDKVSEDNRPGNQKAEYLAQYEIGELVEHLENVRIIKDCFRSIDWDQKFDAIFIDGNHSYNEILADSLLAMNLLTEHGLIIWHDVNNVQDVNDALKQLNTKYDIVSIHNTWIAYLDSHEK